MSDYQQARRTYYRLRCEQTRESLHKNDFEAFVVENRAEAADQVLELIEPEATVGVPGSVTIRELGLLEALEDRGNQVVHHWLAGISDEERRELRIQQLNSDVLLTGTNALTLHGQLVNIDGTGNRVASMVFGPRKVIVVAGANKLCDDLDGAVQRVKRVAAPINALRLGLDTPCARTGYCVDCTAAQTICAITVIIDKRPSQTEFAVVLVPEELGY